MTYQQPDGQQPYGQPSYGQQPYGQPSYAQQPQQNTGNCGKKRNNWRKNCHQ